MGRAVWGGGFCRVRATPRNEAKECNFFSCIFHHVGAFFASVRVRGLRVLFIFRKSRLHVVGRDGEVGKALGKLLQHCTGLIASWGSIRFRFHFSKKEMKEENLFHLTLLRWRFFWKRSTATTIKFSSSERKKGFPLGESKLGERRQAAPEKWCLIGPWTKDYALYWVRWSEFMFY